MSRSQHFASSSLCDRDYIDLKEIMCAEDFIGLSHRSNFYNWPPDSGRESWQRVLWQNKYYLTVNTVSQLPKTPLLVNLVMNMYQVAENFLNIKTVERQCKNLVCDTAECFLGERHSEFDCFHFILVVSSVTDVSRYIRSCWLCRELQKSSWSKSVLAELEL